MDGVSLTQWDSIIGQIVLKITLVSEKTHLTNDLSRVSTHWASRGISESL